MLASGVRKLKERLKSIRQKSLVDLVRNGPVASFKRRMEKEKVDLAKEGRGMRSIAFFLSLVSQILILSFVPLFPQPLPVLVAVLVAFLVYVNPSVGMSLGSIPIVLAILYHLSLVDFITMLGSMEVRALFVLLMVFFFVALPIRFRRYEDAVGINLGIIAASLLFFNSTFFMAIPLLLTVAVLFKKTQAGLAFSYYALISVPLMLLQYFQHILTIARVDYWNDPSAVPPIYVSLSAVFDQMQTGMVQFRLFDFSQTVGKVLWNVVGSPPTHLPHTALQAVNQYLDSFPGIVMFISLVVGLAWATSLILPSLTRSGVSKAETVFPVLTSAGVTAVFFILVSGLQTALAFSTKLNSTQMTLGVLATILFAIPAATLNFVPKKRAEVEKNSQIILVKAGAFLSKLRAFEDLLAKVKSTVPVDVTATETRTSMVNDRLIDIIAKAEARKFKLPETHEKIKELDRELAEKIDGLLPELNLLLEQYQITLNYSYTSWIKRLQEIGYEIKDPLKIEFRKDQTPEERVEYISKMLAISRQLANEVCSLADQVYSAIRSMYDPDLPAENRTVQYSKQKLVEKAAPWIACEALVTVFQSWTKQYGADISRSRAWLQESLGTVTALQDSDVVLRSALGQVYPKVTEEIAKAAQTSAAVANKAVNVLNVVFLQESIQNTVDVVRNVLSILYGELSLKEASIESLMPVDAGFWEKNATLREQAASAVERLSNPKKYSLNNMMRFIPSALSIIDPCLWTVSQYSLKNERLLNYPIAKTAIRDILKKKDKISVQDLPFRAEEAEEYLKLFFNERNQEFSFDEENLLLSKKT